MNQAPCPHWCKYQGTQHFCCTSKSVYADQDALSRAYATLIMLHGWDGTAYTPVPHVFVAQTGVLDGHVAVQPGAASTNLAGLLDALGHADLAEAVRQLAEIAGQR